MKKLLLLVLSITSLSFVDNTAHAANLNYFDAGNIMSNYIMSKNSSMTESQVQSFLKSKAVCNSKGPYANGSYYYDKLAKSPDGKTAYTGSYTWNIKDGHFVCMADDTFGGETAARIIWQASQDYRINPQVLIVLLQKEQGLVTDGYPNNIQFRSATGYGCPDNADCNGQYYGFKNQIRNAANFFRAHLDNNPNWYKPKVPGINNILFNPNTACSSSPVNILNRATSALYSYTPYQPNRAALAAGYGTGDGCSSYGNRNFWNYFTDWFGSTSGYMHNGVDYSSVFDAEYYLNRYVDLKVAFADNFDAAFRHFISDGMSEGRQGIDSFDAVSYRNRYLDLRYSFENNLPKYYTHFAMYGRTEGRSGLPGATLIPTATMNGVNYSKVYSYDFYTQNNPDILASFGTNDIATLRHFINNGMSEGRRALDSFNITSYRSANLDLRRSFGNNLKQYYMHYLNYGHSENRITTGDTRVGIASLNGVNYSRVYNFDYYTKNNPDIYHTFGLDDMATLKHFVNDGMKESRQAINTFNVIKYKDNNADLRSSFGNDQVKYFLHYINFGHTENRTAI